MLKDKIKGLLAEKGEISGFVLKGYDRKNYVYMDIDKMIKTLVASGYDETKLIERKPINYTSLIRLVKKEDLEKIRDHVTTRVTRVERIVLSTAGNEFDESEE